MPGPAPTPTNVLDGRGSWRAKTRPNEPVLELAKPRVPAHLGDEARKVWKRVCATLHEMRVLTRADQDVVALYCQAVADVARFSKYLTEKGETYELEDTGSIRRRPETLMLREARELVVKLSQHLGLSPAYRSKVTTVDEPEQADGKGRFFA